MSKKQKQWIGYTIIFLVVILIVIYRVEIYDVISTLLTALFAR